MTKLKPLITQDLSFWNEIIKLRVSISDVRNNSSKFDLKLGNFSVHATTKNGMKELSFCHKLKLFIPDCVNLWHFKPKTWHEISKVYVNGLQRCRDSKIRVCGDLIYFVNHCAKSCLMDSYSFLISILHAYFLSLFGKLSKFFSDLYEIE